MRMIQVRSDSKDYDRALSRGITRLAIEEPFTITSPRWGQSHDLAWELLGHVLNQPWDEVHPLHKLQHGVALDVLWLNNLRKQNDKWRELDEKREAEALLKAAEFSKKVLEENMPISRTTEVVIEERLRKQLARLDKLGDALDLALDVATTILQEPVNFQDLPRTQLQVSLALMILSRVVPRMP